MLKSGIKIKTPLLTVSSVIVNLCHTAGRMKDTRGHMRIASFM